MEESKDIIAGLAGVKLEPAEYSLGSGLRISQTYAHMMAHFMMAYSPAKPGQTHPSPWSAVSGGAFTYDIYTELEVPGATLVGLDLDTSFMAWWITAILRLRIGPVFIVPVIGEQVFAEAKVNHSKARFYPVEIYNPILVLDPNARRIIYEVDLAWAAKHWLPALRLYQEHGHFRLFFEAVDQATLARHESLALLWLWGWTGGRIFSFQSRT